MRNICVIIHIVLLQRPTAHVVLFNRSLYFCGVMYMCGYTLIGKGVYGPVPTVLILRE